MTAPLGPVLVRVTRYACPHCSRSRSRKAATAAHIDRCWHNPANRTCKTCEHFDPGGDTCGCEPGCNWGASGPDMPSCNARVPLPADFTPVTNCPEWSQR
ncbi:hypothetical protein ACIQVR_39425 [Streptomyces xanthochromogenes]|uniref:hypothetical protein n=1 Tax=Streptomyces xanthochromogenes TaxID=67384 RepID=UPI0037FF480C